MKTEQTFSFLFKIIFSKNNRCGNVSCMVYWEYTKRKKKEGFIMFKKCVAVLLCVTMLLCVTGCDELDSETPTKDPSSTTTSTTATTTTTTKPQLQYNIVTGLEDIPMGAATRPVGIMISNDNYQSRPQANIDRADMYVEIETEGAITRLMAVFGSADRIPEAITPVRSARTPFVQVAQALDLIYVHCGGSYAAKQMLKSISIADADEQTNGSYFWRDKELLKVRSREYTLTTSGEKIAAMAKAKGFADTPKAAMPFDFGNVTGTGAGALAQVKISRSETVSFHYDATSGLYTKYFGDAASTEKHVSLTGNPIQVSNVVVLYGDKFQENSGGNAQTYGFDLSSGSGTVISGGKSRSISYTLSASGFTMYEADGSQLKLNTGKTYICIADKDYRSGFILS